MTSPLAGSLAKTIGSAFKNLFLDATLTRDGPPTGPAYDPTPGAAESYSCRAIVEVYSASYRASGLVQINDRRVLILANSLGVRPLPGDRVTIQGVTFVVQEVETDPATAVWTCRGRM